MKPVYLAGAVRTPIGRFGGSLQSCQAKHGLATLCISGGMGIALLVERV
jgi:acetyl-CoA acetyltransferase